MKLNLDFYKSDIKYNELNREEFIINNYICNYNEEDYESIFKRDNNIESLYCLSNMRKNIISWYPFVKDSSVLEIGAGLGEITGELCKKVSRVVSVEFSKERGRAISKRHKNKENLEIIIGDLKDIEFSEKFDYITLIGVLEYAPNIYKTENPYIDLLEYVKKLLKPNGKILIATDNKFGMRNWSVVSLNDKDLQYDAVSSSKVLNKSQLISKSKLEEMFESINLGKRKYYYPLPDYKYTNVIFTDSFLPNQNNLHRNMTFFKDTDIINFHENSAYLELVKNDKNMFEFFANSYFIEISQDLVENDIKYVSFWNNRKPEYRLKTIIKGNKVYKYPADDLAKAHIETIKKNIDILKKSNIETLDEYDDEKIISNFMYDGKSYDELILEEYEKYGIDKVVELINEFKEKILDKLEITNNVNNVFDNYNIIYKKEEIKDLKFVKNGLWDLNFQNCFEKENKLYIYDQEWVDAKVPLEFIIYRGILIFSELKNKINVNELYQKLGILKYKELFDKLEDKIEDRAYFNPIRMANHKPMKNVRGFIVENNDLRTKNTFINSQLQKLEKVNNITQEEIDQMRNKIKEQSQKLTEIENSKGWRLTLKIRKIISCFKRKEEK